MEELAFTCHYYQQEGLEDFKHSLLFPTLELEEAIISSHEEISRKDEEIAQLKCILAKVIKDRDEFQSKWQQLALEKHLQAHPDYPITSSNTTSDDHDADTDDNSTSGVASGCRATLSPSQSDMVDKPIPEKGKLLKAVMEAGPLLQTLLLAGPLPQWQHPPPQLKSFDIPPVTISSPKLLHQDACLISPNKRTMANMESSPNPDHPRS